MDTFANNRDGAAERKPYNPPGLPALAYRIGTHPTFLDRMLARLHAQAILSGVTAGNRPLAALTTRDHDDPAIALLDAWAMVADVITFYQERIANEGYLRTATERRSVLELARAVGYELRPGVAANTFLAFTVEDAPGAPTSISVPQGAKVQSIPSQGQLPQTFETDAPLTARAEWNVLRPRLTRPQELDGNTRTLYLDGTATGLRPGDLLLLADDSTVYRALHIRDVIADTQGRLTRVDLEDGRRDEQPAAISQVFAFGARVGFFGTNAPLYSSLSTTTTTETSPGPASDPDSAPATTSSTTSLPRAYRGDWDADGGRSIWTDSQGNPYVESDAYLDRSLSEIVPGSWVVFECSAAQSFTVTYRVVAVSDVSLADYASSGRATGLRLTQGDQTSTLEKPEELNVRKTTAFVDSKRLDLADLPVGESIPRGTSALTLDRLVPGLRPGQLVAIGGERADLPGELVSEVVVLADVTDIGGYTTLSFQTSVRNSYLRGTVTLNGNVVSATHGETVANEVLGSGDGGLANQRFGLSKPPLTYVSAPIASGAASTLVVRVNGVRWQEVPSLYGLSPRSQSYTVRRDDGATAVIFGDGASGARLPTGQENVVASYRSGIGLEGEVAAGAVSLLQARPLGIREVTNPVPATGAAPPETLTSARGNAPRTVVTLERIVSLRDFGAFARAFAGIGKADAVSLWAGAGRVVYLTIASANGQQVDRASALYTNLVRAIRAASNQQPFQIVSFEPRFFDVKARLWINQSHSAEAVVADAREALTGAFAFEQRAFGQGVLASEVISVFQAIPGFVAVDLDLLFETGQAPELKQALTAQPLRVIPAMTPPVQPAQLLLINPDGIAIDWAYAP